MLKQGLISEFNYEAENTRKLLKSIPNSALDYRPQPHLWSVGQLAQHIANIYTWFDGTLIMINLISIRWKEKIMN